MKIKALARSLGFDAIGITHAGPFALAGERLISRIEAGVVSGYGFRRDRIDDWITPERALSGAKSILAVALSYAHEEECVPEGGLRGEIARFARGPDYHLVLQSKLAQLSQMIERELGISARSLACADSGPILDRPAALRAGIGWQGRNGCIYVRDLGSWVVLGELLLDIELEPDSPTEGNRCGGCDRCQKACPTGALKAPFTLEIPRCVSHLTQMVGSIPESLRASMGTTIYGCDLCQRACPHNAHARAASHAEMNPTLGPGRAPLLLKLANISQEEFQRHFGGSALGRIGRRRLRRNALVALGNLGDREAANVLRSIARGPDALLREHAFWALDRLDV